MLLKRLFISLPKKIIKKLVAKTPLYPLWQKRAERLRWLHELNELKRAEEKVSADTVSDILVVNLNANDICNSKCAMCNIWEQKQGFEFSPQELQTILSDPLFQTVKHIGVTGGEPTLREDLPQLFEAIIAAIPNIVGLSTITNCIKDKDVISRIDQSIAVCEKHGKYFSMMISLDGVGAVHDRIRGREGNFDSAMRVYKYFTQKGIPISTGSTISKGNVWDMDDLLQFMKDEGIYGRFRVAEFIKRLYNDNKAANIRNFNEDETYNLILFFYKLLFTFEKDETYQRTYKSIINILDGGERLIGCPYQRQGVVLNSRAELAYCAPKSEVIGNALNNSGKALYENNLHERKRVLTENCKSCIHDYHAPITYREKKIAFDDWYWRKRINIESELKPAEIEHLPVKREYTTQIFITGWYGTETVGDKAILAGIVEELQAQYPAADFVVSSLYPIITKRTLKELGIQGTVVPVYSSDFVSYVKGSSLVLMGGGPLMDLEELSLPLTAFKIAKQYGIKTMVYGCGIGPLYYEKYRKATQTILNLADEILVRDQKSKDIATEWTQGRKTIQISGDPAKIYLQRFSKTDTPVENKLTCYLREWTHEYSADISVADFEVLKEKMESGLAALIKRKARELNVSVINLDHMHNFVVGNDDRDFSRYFIRKYFHDFDIPVQYNNKLSTVDSIVEAMKSSQHNICMRFHSVVFAHTLQTEFTAFDYTKGGKILNYLTDNKQLDRMITIDDLTA